MNNPNQLVIIGGGSSIKEGIELGLWDKLKDKYTIGCNYSYNHFIPTLLACVDWKFYDDNRETLKDLPLIVTREKKRNVVYMENTITIPTSMQYTRDLSGGVYSGVLTGIFSLSLGIRLLDVGEIFILGLDWTTFNQANKPAQTHYYQGTIKHRGVGKIDYYNVHKPNEVFKVYDNEDRIKIYNVSLNSNINNFVKISYNEFFDKLNTAIYNQNELRLEIKSKLIKP